MPGTLIKLSLRARQSNNAGGEEVGLGGGVTAWGGAAKVGGAASKMGAKMG